MNAPHVSIRDGRTDVLAAAVALRWSRPDLTRVLAEHLMEQADARGDREAWLVAAGWRVHAIHCVGDGRGPAAEALEQLRHWDDGALLSAAAGRLRVALAVVAHDSGDPAAASLLIGDVDTVDPELEADRCTVLARLAAGDGGAAHSAAEAAWNVLTDDRAGVGAAELLLLSVVSERREGRAESATARAVAGLTRLDRARGAAGAPTPAGHLAAALAAEWIAALVDAGQGDQAREVIGGLVDRLDEPTRPTRQLAYLRSTIARVLASDTGSDAAEELERAARDASAADVPDLEHVCRVALGELHEAHGRVGAAVESVRLAVLAQRRHHARAARLRTALATTTRSLGVARAAREPRGSTGPLGEPGGPVAGMERRGRPADATNGRDPARSDERTAVEPDVPVVGAAGTDADDPVQRTAVLTAITGGSGATGPGATGPWATGSWGRDDRPAAGPVPNGHGAAGRPGGAAGPPERDGDRLGESVRNGRHDPPAAGPRADRPRPSRHRRGERVADRPDRPVAVDGPDGVGPSGAVDPIAAPARPDRSADGTRRSGGGAGPIGGAEPVSGGPAAPAAEGTDDPWLTAALAELDRIWRSPAEELSGPVTGSGTATAPAVAPAARPGVPDAGDSDPGDSDPGDSGAGDRSAEGGGVGNGGAGNGGVGNGGAGNGGAGNGGAGEGEAGDGGGCVVVLDLTLDAGPLASVAAETTMRDVAARLADHLPPGARLRVDSPGSRAVVMPGSDRAAASAWVRETVPGLVEDLTVDGAAAGALLRASVHGTDGVAGAQVLQRLNGAAAHATARTSRFPAPGSARVDSARAEWMRGRSARLAALGIGRPATGLTPAPRLDAADAPRGDDALGATGIEQPSAPPGPGAGGVPNGSWGATGPEHGPARRPYLPDGVVVRPGSGGRRHRSDDVGSPGPRSTTWEPPGEPAGGSAPRTSAPAAPSSEAGSGAPTDPDDAGRAGPVDGLGLADLLAGALAEYRRI